MAGYRKKLPEGPNAFREFFSISGPTRNSMPAPRPALCRSRRTAARASGVMRSPETAMGMAGGQPTVGRAANPPQGVGGIHGFPGSKGSLADGAGALPRARAAGGDSPPRGTAPGPRPPGPIPPGCSPGWPSAPRKSRSAYLALHALAPQLPGQLLACHPPRGAATVTPQGSLGSTRQPAAVSLSRSSAKRSTASARRWG